MLNDLQIWANQGMDIKKMDMYLTLSIKFTEVKWSEVTEKRWIRKNCYNSFWYDLKNFIKVSFCQEVLFH